MHAADLAKHGKHHTHALTDSLCCLAQGQAALNEMAARLQMTVRELEQSKAQAAAQLAQAQQQHAAQAQAASQQAKQAQAEAQELRQQLQQAHKELREMQELLQEANQHVLAAEDREQGVQGELRRASTALLELQQAHDSEQQEGQVGGVCCICLCELDCMP